MTGNKRYSFNWERGHPNFWDNHCDLADCYLTCEDVVNRLNELNDKYNEIKEQYADDCNEANSMTLRIAELSEENEQLKQRIKELEIENTAQSDAIDGLQGFITHFDLEELDF